MTSKINYYVIGGQYNCVNYGGCETLLGAKRKATQNAEYWDNWQGWHTPAIYDASDIDPETGAPVEGSIPVAVFSDGKWGTPSF